MNRITHIIISLKHSDLVNKERQTYIPRHQQIAQLLRKPFTETEAGSLNAKSVLNFSELHYIKDYQPTASFSCLLSLLSWCQGLFFYLIRLEVAI